MCVGIALLASELPLELIERHDLTRWLHKRQGEEEVRFLFRYAARVLPVWHQGQLIVAQWGGRQRGGVLPCTGWTWQATIDAGTWGQWGAEPVEIPATYGLEGGVWFDVRQGIRGLLVRDAAGLPVVYMICLPATRYYQVMTRSNRMPLLIGQTI